MRLTNIWQRSDTGSSAVTLAFHTRGHSVADGSGGYSFVFDHYSVGISSSEGSTYSYSGFVSLLDQVSYTAPVGPYADSSNYSSFEWSKSRTRSGSESESIAGSTSGATFQYSSYSKNNTRDDDTEFDGYRYFDSSGPLGTGWSRQTLIYDETLEYDYTASTSDYSVSIDYIAPWTLSQNSSFLGSSSTSGTITKNEDDSGEDEKEVPAPVEVVGNFDGAKAGEYYGLGAGVVASSGGDRAGLTEADFQSLKRKYFSKWLKMNIESMKASLNDSNRAEVEAKIKEYEVADRGHRGWMWMDEMIDRENATRGYFDKKLPAYDRPLYPEEINAENDFIDFINTGRDFMDKTYNPKNLPAMKAPNDNSIDNFWADRRTAKMQKFYDETWWLRYFGPEGDYLTDDYGGRHLTGYAWNAIEAAAAARIVQRGARVYSERFKVRSLDQAIPKAAQPLDRLGFGKADIPSPGDVVPYKVPGVGTVAVTPPHFGMGKGVAGKHPALMINGKVYVHYHHLAAQELAKIKPMPTDLYGFVELDAKGNVIWAQWVHLGE